MNLDILEVDNGWVVRPGFVVQRQGGFIGPDETHVFNKFEDMCEFLRQESTLLKKVPQG